MPALSRDEERRREIVIQSWITETLLPTDFWGLPPNLLLLILRKYNLAIKSGQLRIIKQGVLADAEVAQDFSIPHRQTVGQQIERILRIAFARYLERMNISVPREVTDKILNTYIPSTGPKRKRRPRDQ